MSQLPAPASHRSRLTWAALAAEPFRVMFPVALLSGILGVMVWPLHFCGVLPAFPGGVHARLMTHGFFAGYILGFLGTALPRMLSAPRLRSGELLALLVLHLAMTGTLALGQERAGDVLLLLLVTAFGFMMLWRVRRRNDLPPPGFILVLLAFACLGAGTALSLFLPAEEETARWAQLQHLLSYQGFVLLPILGVGAFLFPRFFGLPNRHDFPEALTPSPEWRAKAVWALGTGLAIVASFFVEAAGAQRGGIALRLAAVACYLLREVPLHRSAAAPGAVSALLKLGLALILAGLAAMLIVPQYRVALLHLTLVGGFALTTMAVATRVVFGHSGHQHLLGAPNRWLKVAVGLMLLAMVTRISGDFWPKIRVSHYNYGAALWVLGALVWAWWVLPKVRVPDPEGA